MTVWQVKGHAARPSPTAAALTSEPRVAASGSSAVKGENFLLLFSRAAAALCVAVTSRSFVLPFIAGPADPSQREVCESLINHRSTLGVNRFPSYSHTKSSSKAQLLQKYTCAYISICMCMLYLYIASLSSAFLSTSLNLSPGCASACTGLTSAGINYMCFPVGAPQAQVIVLHRRTRALTCISVRAPGCPQVGLGAVSGRREPLELSPLPPPAHILRRLIFLPAASEIVERPEEALWFPRVDHLRAG